MTNEELIAKIKAEIGKKVLEAPINAEGHQRVWAYNDVIDLLSTLESEKPMNQDEALNEEIKKEMVKLPFFIRGKDQIAFARHFAEWGAEHLKK